MENYCTLFNSNYLSRGLNLYYSIKKVSKNFRLYIFAFDNLTLKYLTTKKLKNVTVISLYEFEDKELKKIKNKRTMTEYFGHVLVQQYYICSKNIKLNHAHI